MFKNMKIGLKLGIGYGLIIIMIVGMSLFAYVQISSIHKDIELIITDRFPKTIVSNKIIDNINIIARALRNELLVKDMASIEKEDKRIDESREKIDKDLSELENSIKTAEGKKYLDKLVDARKEYLPIQQMVRTLIKEGKKEEAVQKMLGELRDAQNQYINAMQELIKFQTELTQHDGENAINLTKSVQTAMLFICLLIIIIGIVAAVIITKSIVSPINQCVKIAEDVSRGKTDMEIRVDSSDETGILLKSINKMVITLNNLIGDMNNMSRQHDLGDIDIVIDSGKYEGAFQKMAENVNIMVNGHLTVIKKAMACVSEFGNGNFDAPLEKFPGKKVFINETIEKVRSNIKEFIAQMKNMSRKHDLGDIDVVIDVNKFQGAFYDMADGVNTMVNGHITVKKKAMACVAEFGKGNFDAPLEKFPGKKAFINDTIEAVRTNLKNIANELIMLIEASKNGALSTRGNAGAFHGDWQKMVKGVNEILDAILEPINEASTVLEKVAGRDLTSRVCGDYKGDHAKIKNSLNSAVDNLDKALQQVSEATEQVSSASQQISAGSQSLAQGANQQASSLEEVSSSLEEMSSMTKQNADNAIQAKGLAGEADVNAKTGSDAMARMSGAINRIKESSDQTAKIVKTIDEIAMQTNLLALNAAVEAARAGEAGRGFAVVAEEVRNLAQRSAQAAKNTADMISDSVKNADDGVKIAVEVSKSFEMIASSAKKVNDLIAEIAAASQEQSQGIDQINSAVAQMDKVTQQNAANSEESASAAEELSSQAEELQGMIGQFVVSESISSQRSVPVNQLSTIHHVPVYKKQNDIQKAGSKKAVKKEKIPTAEQLIPLDDEVLKEF